MTSCTVVWYSINWANWNNTSMNISIPLQNQVLSLLHHVLYHHIPANRHLYPTQVMLWGIPWQPTWCHKRAPQGLCSPQATDEVLSHLENSHLQNEKYGHFSNSQKSVPLFTVNLTSIKRMPSPCRIPNWLIKQSHSQLQLFAIFWHDDRSRWQGWTSLTMQLLDDFLIFWVTVDIVFTRYFA